MADKHKGRTRVQSQAEREKRQHHSEVRKLKQWCYQNGIICKSYKEAENDDICVLSRSEYDLHEAKAYLVEDNESYFLSPTSYETWCDED